MVSPKQACSNGNTMTNPAFFSRSTASFVTMCMVLAPPCISHQRWQMKAGRKHSTYILYWFYIVFGTWPPDFQTYIKSETEHKKESRSDRRAVLQADGVLPYSGPTNFQKKNVYFGPTFIIFGEYRSVNELPDLALDGELHNFLSSHLVTCSDPIGSARMHYLHRSLVSKFFVGHVKALRTPVKTFPKTTKKIETEHRPACRGPPYSDNYFTKSSTTSLRSFCVTPRITTVLSASSEIRQHLTFFGDRPTFQARRDMGKAIHTSKKSTASSSTLHASDDRVLPASFSNKRVFPRPLILVTTCPKFFFSPKRPICFTLQ